MALLSRSRFGLGWVRFGFIALVLGGVLASGRFALAQQTSEAVPPGFVRSLGLAGHVTQAIAQPDGKLLVLGTFARQLVRLNADGSEDTTFQAALPKAYLDFRRVAVAPDGKIFVVGSPSKVAKPAVLRLNADGSRDAGFQQTGQVSDNDLDLIVPTLDGGVIASALDEPQLYRFKADGSLDASFQSPSFLQKKSDKIALLNAAALQTDGKLLVGGRFLTVNGIKRSAIVRLQADGSVDESFNAAVKAVPIARNLGEEIKTILVQPDGKFIVAAASDYFAIQFHKTERPNLARLNADGSLDDSFLPQIDQRYEFVESVALLPGGKVALQGTLFTAYKPFADRLFPLDALVLNADGSRFAEALNEADPLYPEAGAFAVYAAGAGDQFYLAAQRILRFNADGSRDNSFRSDAAPGPNGAATVLIQPDGKFILYGSFSAFNGEPSVGLVRVNADGSPDAGFQAALVPGSPVLSAALQPDGKLLLTNVSALRADGSVYTGQVTRLNADGSLDEGFNLGGGLDFVSTVQALPDGKLLVYGSAFISRVTTSYLIRYKTDGSVDVVLRSFAYGIYSATPLPDGKLLVASPDGLLRFLDTGAADTSFNVPYAGTASGSEAFRNVPLAVPLADGKILAVGGFATVRPKLTQLNADGSVDASFTPYKPKGTINAVTPLPDGKLLVASTFVLTTYGTVQPIEPVATTNVGQLTRLNVDGSVDGSFAYDGALTGDFSGIQIAVRPDGQAVINPKQDGSPPREFFFGPANRFGPARVGAAGNSDLSFDAAAAADGAVQTQVLLADGKLLVSGSFTAIGGAARNYVARLYANGTADPGFVPGVGDASSGNAAPPVVGVVVSAPEATVQPLSKGQFIISRAGGDLSRPLTVHYALKGSAVNGTDYRLISGSKIIPAGASSVSIKLLPLAVDDASLKRAKLVLSLDAAYTVGQENEASLNVIPGVP